MCARIWAVDRGTGTSQRPGSLPALRVACRYSPMDFDRQQDDAIGALHSPVGLRVVDRGEHDFGSDALAKIFERLLVKLFAIVYRQLFRFPESVYDVLPENFLDCLGGYIYQGLSFDPFGEVFNSHHCVFVISSCCGQRAYKVHSPPLEGPSGGYQLQGFRRSV